MSWHPTHTDPIIWGGQQINDTDFLSTRVGVIVTQFNGLVDQPPMRTSLFLRPGKHGARRGDLLLAPRPFTIEGVVHAVDHDDLEARKTALQDALVPLTLESALLQFTHQEQGAQRVEARVEQELTWGDPFEMGTLNFASFIVGCVAHDPRRYSESLSDLGTSSIQQVAGGLTFPLTFPISFTPGGLAGLVTIPAAGNFERGAIVQMFGPVTNPVVEVVGDESERNITFAGLSVGAGESVTIDLDEQTAIRTTASSAEYGSITQNLGPVGYWRLGESSGTTAVDLIAGRNGTYVNGVTLGATGPLLLDPNTAADFDGTDDYMEVPFDAALNPASPWSVEMWIKPDAIGSIGTLFDTFTAAVRGLRLEVLSTGEIQVVAGTGASNVSASGTTALSAGTWYHIGYRHDAGTHELYLNGALEVSVAGSYSPNTASAMRIGRNLLDTNAFDGKIDELAVFNYARTPGSFAFSQQLATAPDIPDTNVYGSLDFDLTRWFLLGPGATTLRYRGSTIADPATMRVQVRAAYV